MPKLWKRLFADTCINKIFPYLFNLNSWENWLHPQRKLSDISARAHLQWTCCWQSIHLTMSAPFPQFAPCWNTQDPIFSNVQWSFGMPYTPTLHTAGTICDTPVLLGFVGTQTKCIGGLSVWSSGGRMHFLKISYSLPTLTQCWWTGLIRNCAIKCKWNIAKNIRNQHVIL